MKTDNLSKRQQRKVKRSRSKKVVNTIVTLFVRKTGKRPVTSNPLPRHIQVAGTNERFIVQHIYDKDTF